VSPQLCRRPAVPQPFCARMNSQTPSLFLLTPARPCSVYIPRLISSPPVLFPFFRARQISQRSAFPFIEVAPDYSLSTCVPVSSPCRPVSFRFTLLRRNLPLGRDNPLPPFLLQRSHPTVNLGETPKIPFGLRVISSPLEASPLLSMIFLPPYDRRVITINYFFLGYI